MAMAAGDGTSGSGGAPPGAGDTASTNPECTIETLQKEIEHLKKRITEERSKLQDKTIGQVRVIISGSIQGSSIV